MKNGQRGWTARGGRRGGHSAGESQQYHYFAWKGRDGQPASPGCRKNQKGHFIVRRMLLVLLSVSVASVMAQLQQQPLMLNIVNTTGTACVVPEYT